MPTFSDDVEPVIHTERLELHHLSAQRLIALYEGDNNRDACDGRPYTNPFGVLSEKEPPIRWRAPQVQRDPSSNKWFIRWIVLRDTMEIIGSTSFHEPPDSEGMVEIGLGLHEKFHRRGFGFESVVGMWTWAATQPHVNVLRYTVSPDNRASVALVKKIGCQHVGQQMDDIDGPEDIYEITAADFRARHYVGEK